MRRSLRGDLLNRTSDPACCPFCQILNSEGTELVATWDDAVAFLAEAPVTEGHILVVPRKHVRDITEDPEVSACLMRRTAELARTLAARKRSPGGEEPQFNVISAVGWRASQSIGHAYIHLVPRRKGDGLLLPWTLQKFCGGGIVGLLRLMARLTDRG